MKEYVKSLKQRFTGPKAFAQFLGVSTDTVKSWTSGRNEPSAEAVRLMQVLGLLALEAPVIFDALIGKEAPARCKPIVLPPLEPIVRHHSEKQPIDRFAAWAAVTARKSTPSEPMLYGKTREEWERDWGSGTDEVMALTGDDYQRVSNFIYGKPAPSESPAIEPPAITARGWVPLTPEQRAARDARNAAKFGPDWDKPEKL